MKTVYRREEKSKNPGPLQKEEYTQRRIYKVANL